MIFDSKEYKRSRAAYMSQCAIEYFVSLLVTDAFLAKLLTHVGISDSLIGIISSFISMAFVIQLMSIFVVRIKASTKGIVTTFDTISVLFFMLLYFVPFIPASKEIKTILIVISILIAYASKYLVISLFFKWANSYVKPTKRARYSANKEILSLISGMLFTAVVGFVIDSYEEMNNIEGGFLFIAISILILNICNFICLINIKKDDLTEHQADNEPFINVIKNTLGNKNFRSVIILAILWDVARYFTIGFVGVFKTKDLAISVFMVQIINILASVFRVLISKPIGRYSDKTSYAKGFELGLILALFGFSTLVFTTSNTWWLIIVYTIFYNSSFAGTNSNSCNIAYSYVDSKYIAQAMAIKNCIGGLFGFGASILGSRILHFVQANNNIILGVHIHGQQILAAISVVFLIAALVFTKKVISKQTVIKQ